MRKGVPLRIRHCHLCNKSHYTVYMMLGTLPKDLFKVATFPRCNFPSGNVSITALGPQPVLAGALGSIFHPSRSARPLLQSAAPQRA